MTRSQPNLNRRALVLGAALAPLIPVAWASAGAVPPALGEFGPMFRKMRYRPNDGVLFWWMKGAKYGQIHNEVKPFHGIEACAITRVTTTPAGWSVDVLEHIFYTDLESGRLLESMTNPFTGKTLDYKRTPARPFTMQYHSDGSLDLPSEIGGAKFESDRKKAILTVHGDEIWVSDDAATKMLPASGAAVYSAEWSTFRCRMTDLADKSLTFVPASLHLQGLGGWQGWMQMGDQPGGLISRIVGSKVATFDEVPETWRVLLAKAHPDVARDPIGSLGSR